MRSLACSRVRPAIPSSTSLTLTTRFHCYRAWLYASPRLISVVYFTFTRLITDHLKQPALTALRQQEINFTSTLLREKVPTCLYESERCSVTLRSPALMY